MSMFNVHEIKKEKNNYLSTKMEIRKACLLDKLAKISSTVRNDFL